MGALKAMRTGNPLDPSCSAGKSSMRAVSGVPDVSSSGPGTVTVSVSERARPSLVQGAPVTLGQGIYHCLGAPLARLEGRIVFETLLERFPEIGLLDERPRFRNGVVLRGLQSLPLRCVRA